jgi:hypothetical protein
MLAAALGVEHYGFTAALACFGACLLLAAAAPAVFSRHLRLRFEEDAAARPRALA